MKVPSRRLPSRCHALVLAAALSALPALSSPAASAYQARVSIDLEQALREINPHIYGQYLEHVEREDECIYPSIWDDQSPFADATGLRRDVIDAARELGVPVVRWPGGCFADVYHWEGWHRTTIATPRPRE